MSTPAAPPAHTPPTPKTAIDRHGNPRCQARSKQTGQQCGRTSIPGGTVCIYHGGKAPVVIRAANLRLLELVNPAIATLAREMAGADSSNVRVRAANSILDRAGLVRKVDGVHPEDAHAVLVQQLIQIRDAHMKENE